MIIPDGGACAVCKHRNMVALPREQRPGTGLPCMQEPLCGYELDPTAIENAKALMQRNPHLGARIMEAWNKSK